MTWLIKFLFFLVFVTFLRIILSRLFPPAQSTSRHRRNQAGTRSQTGTIQGHMVKDPHCGMYVASQLAVADHSTGEPLHFCSEECRREFLQVASERTGSRRTRAAG